MKVAKTALLLLFIFAIGYTQTLDCKKCHYCEKPTSENPCLKRCPRHDLPAGHISTSSQQPDVIILKELESLYVPVVFSHKLHSEMADFSRGCSICHHHNPAGPILKCSSCHEKTSLRGDLHKPGLKGAYHRQCMGCHREWSHSTACGNCHALKSKKQTPEPQKNGGDLVGSAHPVIPEPDRIIFRTDYKEGNLVTFYHDDHTKVFGLKCVDCHRQESCDTCHDTQKEKITETHLTEPHDPCFQCHENHNCNVCHTSEIRGNFDHLRRSGWALNKFHSKLKCRDCHQGRTIFAKLDNTCLSCHKSWLEKGFNHSITGLTLDETHKENACEDCHLDKRFDQPPSCDNCHDGYRYPVQRPGE